MPVYTLLGVVTSLASMPVLARAADTYEIESRENLEYGTGGGEKLSLDLYRPKNLEMPLPAIVYIHGGGWAGGKRQDMALFAKAAATQGYLTVTISYRLAPKNRFPAQIEDCKCAVRYLRAHADELKLDPQRIGAIGASAGAHLSMMLGVMDKPDGLEGEGGWSDQPSKVQAVVSFVGPTNLDDEYPPVSKGIVLNFIGGTREEMKETYRKASPIVYVDKADAPMLLLQGTTDVLVPYDQAFQMCTALHKAGVAGRVEMLIGQGHGWGGKELERTLRVSLDFMREQLVEKK
jgi:acetyl esterase/lipase